jgi:hypothetical protein
VDKHPITRRLCKGKDYNQYSIIFMDNFNQTCDDFMWFWKDNVFTYERKYGIIKFKRDSRKHRKLSRNYVQLKI